MSLPITLTKIIVPRRSYHLLPRPRLLDMLADLLHHRLTLIAAPAGYGKTSLLIDWAATVEFPICWYALDPLDKNVHRFIVHFISSIQQQFSEFGNNSSAVLHSMGQSELNLDHLVSTIVNEIYEHVSEHFAIILDDYHLIEAGEEVNYFINRFGQEMDENCHLVIASRSLLRLPDLPIMVGRSQVMGLGFEELVFSPQEIQALLKRNYNQQVSDMEAGSLARETEGWITGLLLSAETMWKGMADRVRVARVSGVNIYDYLAQQVLDQQHTQVREFLLRTSLLEEFNAQLCQTVFGQPPIGTSWFKLINTVLHHNLFVQPVENGGTWLRYHHLFRDFLQEQLSKEQPREEERLLRKLVDVYSEREEWEKAYSICQRLDDDEVTINLVEQAFTPMARAGLVMILDNWYDALPANALKSRPFLTALFGSIALDLGEADKALIHLNSAESALQSRDESLQLARTLTWKANAYLYLGDYQIALKVVNQALDLAKSKATPHIAHAEALRVKGVLLRRLGQINSAITWLTQSLYEYRAMEDDVNAAIVQESLGMVYMNIGQHSNAINFYQNSLELWREMKNFTRQANLLNNMGVSYHLSGDLIKAKNCLDEALDRAKQGGLVQTEAFTLASLGDLYVDIGFLDAAREQYRLARQLAQQLEFRYLLLYLVLAEAGIMRREGDLTEAELTISATENLAEEGRSSYEASLWALEKGCLLIAQDKPSQAIAYLSTAAQNFNSSGQQIDAARSLLYLAMAHYILKEIDLIKANLSRAAQVTSELESTYPLLAVGRDVQEMLMQLKQESETHQFAISLLNQIEDFDRNLPRLRRQIREQDERTSLSPPVLNVQALGESQVELNGEPVIAPEWSYQRKVRELFFLLLEYPKGLTVEGIGDALWPGGELQMLQKRYNNAVYRVRRSLGKDIISYDQGNGRYQFNWEMDYRFDVESFCTNLEHAQNEQDINLRIGILKDAIEYYRGQYLPKVDGTWAAPIREKLRRAFIEAVLEVAEFYFQDADYEKTLEYCNRIFTEESSQEVAHRLAMRVYAAQGNRSEVVKQYERIKLALQAQFSVSPSRETEVLLEKLMGK